MSEIDRILEKHKAKSHHIPIPYPESILEYFRMTKKMSEEELSIEDLNRIVGPIESRGEIRISPETQARFRSIKEFRNHE